MKLLKEKAYDFLNQFIEKNLLSSSASVKEALTKGELIDISGKNFVLQCWEESAGTDQVVCVELSRKKMLFLSEAYSLGVLFSDGVKRKLKQEELWDMGF